MYNFIEKIYLNWIGIIMIKRLIESIGNKFGVVVVPDWRATRLDEERHLSKLLRYLNVDCVFDVGANVGQYGRMLRDYVGYRRTIISFEPNPIAFNKLKIASAGDQQWHCEQLALGNTTGFADFHAYDQSDLGSFRDFKKSIHAPKKMNSKTVSVRVEKIENYINLAKEKYKFKRPFLKIDTQGFDLEVAKGSGNAIKDFVGLQSEIAFQNIYDNSPDYISSIKLYESFGFTISRLIPIHEAHFPDLVEMDVIMIRSDLIVRS
jgi:FkbM family methyltransferase